MHFSSLIALACEAPLAGSAGFRFSAFRLIYLVPALAIDSLLKYCTFYSPMDWRDETNQRSAAGDISSFVH